MDDIDYIEGGVGGVGRAGGINRVTKAHDGKRRLIDEIADAASSIQYKLLFFVFIIFIILSSDTFINRILTKINGAVSDDFGSPTNFGTTLQALLLVLALVIIDGFIQLEIL